MGDPAYPLLDWLVKPYIGANLSPEKESFNAYLSSVRISVEQTFGKLKTRWRVCGKQMDFSIKEVPSIVIACCICILHNICENENCPVDMDLNEEEDFTQPPQLQSNTESNEGTDIRDALCKHINDNFPRRKQFHRT